MEKLLATQKTKLLLTKSSFAATKTAIHLLSNQYLEAQKQFSDLVKNTTQNTDNIRLLNQIDAQTELLNKEQDKVQKIVEESLELNAEIDNYQFDVRGLRYEVAQQQNENRRLKRALFELQSTIDLQEKINEETEELYQEFAF
jgi:chromosome segregation ATPase